MSQEILLIFENFTYLFIIGEMENANERHTFKHA